MAVLHPFSAWHPSPEQVEEIACVPYDVINEKEARKLAQGKPKSFLHVIRPEIDLPDNTDLHADEVYKKGAENLRQFLTDGTLRQEDESQVYVYRITRKGRPQTGIFSCVSVNDYDDEVIVKHELTRPVKEDDRTKHIVAQQAHAEPVMLTYKDDERLQHLIDETVQEESMYDFIAPDGVQHQIWRVSNTTDFVEAFAGVPNLYIADGHHRCKSASRAAAEMKNENSGHTGSEEYNFFPAVIFPMSNMNILAYNRLVHTVPDDFLSKLQQEFDLCPNAEPEPSKKGDISIYINDEWYGLTLPVNENPSSVERLDVYRLQEFVLSPLLGIEDPRTDTNLSFVGGGRGTDELEGRVENGVGQMAVSMYPTSIEELVDVSDEGLLMPPKSTWFEPKLRSGLLIHTF